MYNSPVLQLDCNGWVVQRLFGVGKNPLAVGSIPTEQPPDGDASLWSRETPLEMQVLLLLDCIRAEPPVGDNSVVLELERERHSKYDALGT